MTRHQYFVVVAVLSVISAACGADTDDGGDDVLSPSTTVVQLTTLDTHDAVDTDSELLDVQPGVVTVHGLAALYRFENPGTTVADRSGVRTPAPLRPVGTRNGTAWLESGTGVAVGTGGGLEATLGADSIDRLAAERAIELWFDPAGPTGTIARLDGEGGPSLRIDLDEDGAETMLRLVIGADVVLSTPYDPESAGWTHVVGSVGSSGSWLYVDGQEEATGPGIADLTAVERFVLGGEDSTWAGAVTYAAVYARVVVGSEVEDHFDAGPRVLVSDGPYIVAVGDVVAPVGEETVVSVDYYDPNGDEMTLTVESTLDVTTEPVPDGGARLAFTPTENDIGTRAVSIEVEAGGRVFGRTFLAFVNDAPFTIDRMVTPALVDGTESRAVLGPADLVQSGERILIADRDIHQVQVVSDDGVEAWLGTGESGFSGDGEVASVESALANPSGVDVGPDGSVYVADEGNNRVRVVRPDGTLETIAGTGAEGFSIDGTPAVDAAIQRPVDVAVADDGTVYIAELGNRMVRAIGVDGTLSTVLGTGLAGRPTPGGSAAEGALTSPVSLAVDPVGKLHVADSGTHQVWRIDDEGRVQLVAGLGIPGFSGDGGPAVDARLTQPSGLAIDPDGRVYIADTGNRRIRRIGVGGVISTVAGNGFPTWASDGTGAMLSGMTPVELSFAPDGDLLIVDPVAGVVAAVSES